jgi:hypothetical protein
LAWHCINRDGWSLLTLHPAAPAFLALELGAILLVLVLLNARDRRRARAIGIVLGACATPLRRGWLSLRVDAPWWSYRTIAVVDVSAGDAEAVWPIVCELVDMLPPDITLAVEMRRAGAPVTMVRRLRSRDATEATSVLATKTTASR